MAEPVRLNLGCGNVKLEGFVNIDDAPECEPDVCIGAFEYLDAREDSSVDEIYLGHFLEHLEYDDGQNVLRECFRVLKSGGKIGVVVPDTEIICRIYLGGQIDLDRACELFFYSTIQPSRHKWSYDWRTLKSALEKVGFVTTKQIGRYDDPRLISAWYQVGWDAEKP